MYIKTYSVITTVRILKYYVYNMYYHNGFNYIVLIFLEAQQRFQGHMCKINLDF